MNKEYMQTAIKLSREKMQQGYGGPFGAVIVNSSGLVATGYNQVTSRCDPSAHAEIVAIRAAGQVLNTFSLQGCDIYSSCEPCAMCLAAIYWARIDNIFYANSKEDAKAIGFDDQWIYEQLNLPKEQRHIPMQQIMRAEAQAAFQEWAAKSDKLNY